MTNFLLNNSNEKEKLKNIFDCTSKKWQKTLLDILKLDHIPLILY